ncbi:MAG: hypothetical protein IPL53_12160 [Ignavibacteria bacterium]|nr:hypothetical protein [Ignavibacteria bacterium]
MYTHELINLLKTLSPKELMRLSRFLNSPYFNNRRRLIDLFYVLKNFYPAFNKKSLTKENIFKRIYGKADYNDSTYRNLMSDLLVLTLKFLKTEGIEKDTVQSSFFLTQELFMRGNYNLFRNRMLINERLLESKHKINSDYFLNKYRILTDNFYVNLMTQKVLKKKYVVSESQKIISGIVCILSYFVLESIKHYDNLLNYSRSYNIQRNFDTVASFIEIFNFEKLISYIRDNSPTSIPIVEIYYNLLKAFTNFEDEKFYAEFKKSLLQNFNALGLDENNFLFSRLFDYCILKMNMGVNTGFNIQNEIFELNNIYLQHKFYITESNKYIPFDFYRNVLINCITLKKHNFMEDFIKTYSKNLLPKHIQSIENYSYALLYFEKGQYNKALACINRIKFDQFMYKLDMKNLQLKINFELNQYESALSVIDAYKHFLKNNVLITESRRVMHSNFVTYANKLIQYRTGSQKVNLSYISDKIEKSKNIIDKGWLIEKTGILQGQNVAS